MISTNVKSPAVKAAPSYPCLKKSTSTGAIYLFSGPNTATLLVKGINTQPIGYHSGVWAEVICEPFTGTVELSNE